MPVSTKRFTLNSAAYQDISEGNEFCSFRLTYVSDAVNGRIHVALGTSLPAAGTQNYDLFEAATAPGEDTVVKFLNLATTDRVYARAASPSAVVSLAVYRK